MSIPKILERKSITAILKRICQLFKPGGITFLQGAADRYGLIQKRDVLHGG